jgi:hypothetical protein
MGRFGCVIILTFCEQFMSHQNCRRPCNAYAAISLFPVRLLLASSHIEREEWGDKEIDIVRIKITKAGRRALQ